MGAVADAAVSPKAHAMRDRGTRARVMSQDMNPGRRATIVSQLRFLSAPNNPLRLQGSKRHGPALLHRGKASRRAMQARIYRRFCCVRCVQKRKISGVFTPLLRL